jgi:predicted O-linked N-acetylglucosamine transferase (SPINDLY family)
MPRAAPFSNASPPPEWTAIGCAWRLVDYGHDMSDIDIALDPFPFNGATTTCHALWMGLAPIALRGKSHASRVSYSILAAMGLEEVVVDDAGAYVQKAVELASDLERLEIWRSSLRDRLLGSPLCDEAGFVRDLERAYRSMWHRWLDEAARS